MPTYDYACASHGGFDALRPVAQRDEACACPDCGAASPRVFVHAPRLQQMAADTRHAMQVNERAAHQPRSSSDPDASYSRLRHSKGCGCCSSTRSKTTTTHPNGAKTFANKRPWMISH